MSHTASKLEAIFDILLADLVDDRERYLGPEGDRWLELGAGQHTRSDQWTEQKHASALAESRWLCEQNPYAVNGLENRANYIIGTGHQYLIGPKRGRTVNDQLLNLLDDFLEDFRRRNRWHSRQIETLRRYDRDGEALIRQFISNDGSTDLRFLEPTELVTPPGSSDNVRNGILFAPADAETPVQYLTDAAAIPADEIQHRKANADFNAARGVPLYWPVRRNLRRANLILRNMATIVEIQSAIAIIRKHTGTGISNLQTLRTNNADASVTNTETGRTDYLKHYAPGSIIDAPKGVEYEFPTAGIEAAGIVNVLKAELRAIAARLVMPEFMFTSDASNAAYASTMVAEGPAVRMFHRLQQSVIHDDLALHHNAIAAGIEFGALPEEAANVAITAEPPNVQVRDFLKQAYADKIAHAAGVLSPQTWSQRLQLDYDREQANIERYQLSAIASPQPLATTNSQLATTNSQLATSPTPRPPSDQTHGSRFPSDDDPHTDP